MTAMLRRARLFCFVSLALAGTLAGAPHASRAADCTSVAAVDSDSGIGGTGAGEPDSGIGGTGVGEPDSGIGGTGIFGTITGFASLCVNGLEVHYAPDVPVTWDGRNASAGELAIGHVVWIAAGDVEEKLVARSISIYSALIGNVEQIDSERRLLRVTGRTVEVPIDAWVFGTTNHSLEGTRGALVEVSGLRRADGRIVASRIDRTTRPIARPKLPSTAFQLREASGLRRASIEGFVEKTDGTHFRVQGVEVDARAAESASTPHTGERVRVSGALRDGVLRADRIVTHPRRVETPDRQPRAPQVRPEPKPELVKPPERPDRVERPELAPRPELPPRPERFDRPVMR